MERKAQTICLDSYFAFEIKHNVYQESSGFFVLTWFSPLQNKNKSKWRLQSKNRSSLGTDFPKLENQPTFSFQIFLPFKSESRRSVDRVMVHSAMCRLCFANQSSLDVKCNNLSFSDPNWMIPIAEETLKP